MTKPRFSASIWWNLASRRGLRLKLWRVSQELMAEAADQYGCEFFSAPESAIDAGNC